MRTHFLVWTLLMALAAGCGDADERANPPTTPPPPAAPRPLRELTNGLFEALPARVEVDRAKMLLGRRLYHDPALSGDGSVSCATCHMLTHGGAEPRRTSTGIRGQTGPINSPTVLNSVHNFVQFWDGRAADLREQAAGPISNPIEMGGDWPAILERMRADATYTAEFQTTYGEAGLTQENVIDAIVVYETYLQTPARFDRWLGGDDSALTEEEQRGLRSFVEVGCTTCHLGRNVGGTMYQRMGLVHNYFERRGGAIREADLGRFNVTHDEADRHKFKVPTLRNVELTAPYFHDGSEPQLQGAIRTMAYVQLNRELTDAETSDIAAFLRSLTGELPPDAVMPGTTATEEGQRPQDAEDVAEAHPQAPVGAAEDDHDEPAAPTPAAP